MLGRVNIVPAVGGGVIEFRWKDRYWSYINNTGRIISIPYSNINSTYINQSYPLLVNNSSSNGLNIAKNATIKLNIIEPVWNANAATMNVGRNYHTGIGNINSCMVQGGSASASILTTESYNGSTWALSANLNKDRYLSAIAGVVNSSIISGGYTGYNKPAEATSEVFNGNTWNLISAILNTARCNHKQTGIINSCMIHCGKDINNNEIFNGSIWINLNSRLNTYRIQYSAVGTSTNCSIHGGSIYNNGKEIVFNSTEYYNGSIWTNSNLLNTNRMQHTVSGNNYNNCTISGGYNVEDGSSSWISNWYPEYYNGNSWNTSRKHINQSRSSLSSTTVSGACMLQGGIDYPNGLNTTETCYWPDDNFNIGKTYIPG